MSKETSAEKSLKELLGGDPGHVDRVLDLLEQLWLERRKHVNERWKRTLPFGEYIVDRWEKARLLGFGEGTSIYDSALVFSDVTVGKNTWIGPHAILDGTGGLTIGDNCSISAGVQIYSHDTIQWAVSGGKSGYDYASTAIGDNCYIGPNTVISKGVKIEDCCIVGANSLVLQNLPSGSKAYGTPCKIYGTLDSTFL
ncbi:acyltransferase [Desulfonatronum parangueonense]